jgi:acyl dehydratase
MALDPAFVGRTYPPEAPYEVGREKIREFADAIGDANPAYLDPAAARALGHPDVIAPPTFAVITTMAAGRRVTHDPELGLDYSRVVHGEQRFVHARPIRAGDRLLTSIVVESIRSAAGNDMISTRADVTTETGEPVLSAYSTLVARGTAGP